MRILFVLWHFLSHACRKPFGREEAPACQRPPGRTLWVAPKVADNGGQVSPSDSDEHHAVVGGVTPAKSEDEHGVFSKIS
jgi:hypothetical protein